MYSTRPTFLQRFELVCLPFFKGTPGTDSMKKLGNQRTWRFLGLKSQILTVDRYWRCPFTDIENGLPGKWWFSIATFLMKFTWGNKHWCGQSTKENHGFSASFSIFTLGYINIFQHLPVFCQHLPIYQYILTSSNIFQHIHKISYYPFRFWDPISWSP